MFRSAQKKDLVEILKTPASKVDVVYHGGSIETTVAGAKKFSLPEKFILYIGHRSQYKNFQVFLESILPLLAKDKDLYLVCAGGNKFLKSESAMIRENGLMNRVVQTSISDAELPMFYRNAVLFAFPSLYEGFGIPLLEAFACECPVVCSNTGSLPEIAQDGAVYFDPSDGASIAQAIGRVINDSDLRKRITSKGAKRLGHFFVAKDGRENQKSI